LLPFATSGLDYSSIAPDNSLTLTNDDGSGGSLTARSIRDRAQLLSWVNSRNFDDANVTLARNDGGEPLDLSWVNDAGANELLHVTRGVSTAASVTKQIAFGGESGETLNGSNKDDAFYGQGGADRLVGGAGNDYLEGGQGTD